MNYKEAAKDLVTFKAFREKDWILIAITIQLWLSVLLVAMSLYSIFGA